MAKNFKVMHDSTVVSKRGTIKRTQSSTQSHGFLLTLFRYIVLENGLRALLISDFSGPAAPEDEDSDKEEEGEEEEDGDSGDETEDESEEEDGDQSDDEDEDGKKKRGNAEKQVMQVSCFDRLCQKAKHHLSHDDKNTIFILKYVNLKQKPTMLV